jgi:hypothetical protein
VIGNDPSLDTSSGAIQEVYIRPLQIKYPTVNKVMPTYFELMTQFGKVTMMQG